MTVAACDVPHDALLQVYARGAGNYTDCFCVAVPRDIQLAAFIEAFYTTWLFRLERAVLTVVLKRRIRDSEVQALAQGDAAEFAAWTVEDRRADQILLRDRYGATRSFLAVEQGGGAGTRLLFGSAVVARRNRPTGGVITATAPLHRFYSRCLLALAARKLR